MYTNITCNSIYIILYYYIYNVYVCMYEAINIYLQIFLFLLIWITIQEKIKKYTKIY